MINFCLWKKKKNYPYFVKFIHILISFVSFFIRQSITFQNALIHTFHKCIFPAIVFNRTEFRYNCPRCAETNRHRCDEYFCAFIHAIFTCCCKQACWRWIALINTAEHFECLRRTIFNKRSITSKHRPLRSVIIIVCRSQHFHQSPISKLLGNRLI